MRLVGIAANKSPRLLNGCFFYQMLEWSMSLTPLPTAAIGAVPGANPFFKIFFTFLLHYCSGDANDVEE